MRPPLYSLRRPTAAGGTELLLTPIEMLDLLSQLVTPTRLHKHRTCGVLAPNAALRTAVTASAGPAGATMRLLEEARASMGEPMRIIAFVLDRPTIERILDPIGEPTQPPRVLPARLLPHLAFGFDQTGAGADWPEMDRQRGRTTAGSCRFGREGWCLGTTMQHRQPAIGRSGVGFDFPRSGEHAGEEKMSFENGDQFVQRFEITVRYVIFSMPRPIELHW